jgi:hypothetical protein
MTVEEALNTIFIFANGPCFFYKYEGWLYFMEVNAGWSVQDFQGNKISPSWEAYILYRTKYKLKKSKLFRKLYAA